MTSLRLVGDLPERAPLSTAAIFKAMTPLLNSRHAHGIGTEILLNLPNGFHLCISKPLADVM